MILRMIIISAYFFFDCLDLLATDQTVVSKWLLIVLLVARYILVYRLCDLITLFFELWYNTVSYFGSGFMGSGKKTLFKTIFAIVIFGVFITTAYFAYGFLSNGWS